MFKILEVLPPLMLGLWGVSINISILHPVGVKVARADGCHDNKAPSDSGHPSSHVLLTPISTSTCKCSSKDSSAKAIELNLISPFRYGCRQIALYREFLG